MMKMTLRSLVGLYIVSMASLLQAGQQPNVLFIFADDMCYETIGAYKMLDIDTPHLDTLVESGTTFTHDYNMGAWNGAVCVASVPIDCSIFSEITSAGTVMVRRFFAGPTSSTLTSYLVSSGAAGAASRLQAPCRRGRASGPIAGRALFDSAPGGASRGPCDRSLPGAAARACRSAKATRGLLSGPP